MRSIITMEFCSSEKYKRIGGPEDTFESKLIVFHVGVDIEAMNHIISSHDNIRFIITAKISESLENIKGKISMLLQKTSYVSWYIVLPNLQSCLRVKKGSIQPSQSYNIPHLAH